MLVALEFEKKNEQTIKDLLNSVQMDFKLFCCGSLELVAESMMERCCKCSNRIISDELKENENIWILFILKKKNDKLILNLLETINVRTLKNVREFFDSQKPQCNICLVKEFGKRSLSIEQPLVKNKTEDETVQKENEPLNFRPRLVEIALVKASGIVVKEDEILDEDMKKEENSDPPTVKKARIEATEPEEVKQELLDKPVEQNLETGDVEVSPAVKGSMIEVNRMAEWKVNLANWKTEIDIDDGRNNTSRNERNSDLDSNDSDYFSLNRKSSKCSKTSRKKLVSNENVEKLKTTYGGEREFSCHKCEKSFHRPVDLKGHFSTVHSDEKRFECDVCQKQFTTRKHLTRHSLIHKGIKSFICDICKKPFSRKEHLTLHKRRIHAQKQ